MKEWVNISSKRLNVYVDSFKDLTVQQQRNFEIKKDHSIRVAENSILLAEKLDLDEEQQQIAFITGLFHDVGRFKQLIEFDTFHDEKSVDHAEYSIQVLQNDAFFEAIDFVNKDVVFKAIQSHNKFKILDGLSEQELMFAKLLRDADKLDILKVLTEYYTNRNAVPNHTLTWDLPKGSIVSSAVAKEVLAGKLVSKKNVASEIDVKIMQLSWVFDLNFKPSFEILLKNRFLELIYGTLPKNDLVIEIHRKIKVYSENKIMQ
jgi:HD superfamily phosphohydrolase YqeK